MSSIHRIRAKLLDQKKMYRDIEIKSSASLYQLAEAIIDSFSFDFDHAFGFYSNCSARGYHQSEEKYELFADMGDDPTPGAKGVEKTKIAQAFRQPKQKMLFLFDYGDNWMFEVEALEVAAEPQKGTRYPKVVQSKGEAPEQYQYPEDDEDEEMNLALPALEGSFAKKYEMTEKVRKMMEILAQASTTSLEDVKQQIAALGFEHFEDDIEEIEAIEVEEEAKAKPRNAKERKLVEFFEGTEKPNKKLLDMWFAEKWDNENPNFPLFRKYAKQDNTQMLALLFFGLDHYPATPELFQDIQYFYNQLPEEHDRSPIIERLIYACDIENEDMELFEELAEILLIELESSTSDPREFLMNHYKSHPAKHRIISTMLKLQAALNTNIKDVVLSE